MPPVWGYESTDLIHWKATDWNNGSKKDGNKWLVQNTNHWIRISQEMRWNMEQLIPSGIEHNSKHTVVWEINWNESHDIIDISDFFFVCSKLLWHCGSKHIHLDATDAEANASDAWDECFMAKSQNETNEKTQEQVGETYWAICEYGYPRGYIWGIVVGGFFQKQCTMSTLNQNGAYSK